MEIESSDESLLSFDDESEEYIQSNHSNSNEIIKNLESNEDNTAEEKRLNYLTENR